MIIGGLIVTHGQLGNTLVEETARLVGQHDKFIAISTHGLSAQEITEKVKEIIQSDPWIIFSDAPGTSPTVRSYAAIEKGQSVISGVNLGMLLSFLVHRESYPIQELAIKMVEDGQRALEVFWPRID